MSKCYTKLKNKNKKTPSCPRLFYKVTTLVSTDLPIHLFPTSIPSPSSLMDLGSDTAKHCMVSYFCCWGSCDSSWFSLCGFTSIRQLNVWLFLLGPSLDHGTPLTAGERKIKREREREKEVRQRRHL